MKATTTSSSTGTVTVTVPNVTYAVVIPAVVRDIVKCIIEHHHDITINKFFINLPVYHMDDPAMMVANTISNSTH